MNIFSSSANSFSLIRSLPLPTFMFECVTFLRLWRCLSRFWRFPFLSQFVSRSLRWRILFKHQFNFQKMLSCQIYTTRYDSHWAERTYAGESSGSNKKNVRHQSCFVRILNSTNLTTWNWEWDNIEQHIIQLKYWGHIYRDSSNVCGIWGIIELSLKIDIERSNDGGRRERRKKEIIKLSLRAVGEWEWMS